MKGILYVAIGPNACKEAEISIKTLREHMRLPIKVLGEDDYRGPASFTNDQKAHYLKVTSFKGSPFDPTLLLDADTRVKDDLSLGFRILKAGWEVVMVPSLPPKNRPGAVLWHLQEAERRITLQELGTWKHVMLNTGLMYFKKTKRVRNLFERWEAEWMRFKDRDQGAFLRALSRAPVGMFLLGKPFNSEGGEVVDHLFGRAR